MQTTYQSKSESTKMSHKTVKEQGFTDWWNKYLPLKWWKNWSMQKEGICSWSLTSARMTTASEAGSISYNDYVTHVASTVAKWTQSTETYCLILHGKTHPHWSRGTLLWQFTKTPEQRTISGAKLKVLDSLPSWTCILPPDDKAKKRL